MISVHKSIYEDELHVVILNHSSTSRINSFNYFVWFFDAVINLVYTYFTENFCICVYQTNRTIIFLFICFYLVLVSGQYWIHKNNLEIVLPFVFYRIIRKVLKLVLLWRSDKVLYLIYLNLVFFLVVRFFLVTTIYLFGYYRSV